MQEGIAVGRSFAMFKNYNIDGNKEMIAIGTMNIVGSFTSCYLTTGNFPVLDSVRKYETKQVQDSENLVANKTISMMV